VTQVGAVQHPDNSCAACVADRAVGCKRIGPLEQCVGGACGATHFAGPTVGDDQPRIVP